MLSKEKTSIVLTTSLLGALILVCSTLALAQSVTYQAMPGTNFASYHTYKWVTIPGGIHPDQITDQEIKQAVNSQLASKGFTKSTGENADLAVCYQVSVDQEKQWNADVFLVVRQSRDDRYAKKV